MLPPTGSGGPEHKRLLSLLSRLPAADRQTLLAFAEFLADRAAAPVADSSPVAEPLRAPRPDNESVIQAMRRLSSSYMMVDSADVLNEAAALMSAHVMQGRPAGEVIDELEILFERAYIKLVEAGVTD